MKNLKKMFAVVTTAAVMCASVPAFAEVTASGAFTSINSAVTADYSAIAQNKVRATVDKTKAIAGSEITFAVLDNDVEDSDILAGNFDQLDILCMGQTTLGDSDYTFEGTINPVWANGAAVDATELPAGSYPIRVAYYYDNAGTPAPAIATATMVVSEGSSGTEVTIVWGDVNSDNDVTGADATQILLKTIGAPPTINVKDTSNNAIASVKVGETLLDTIVWGDVNSDNDVTGADATQILLKTIGAPPTINVKDTSNNAVASVKVGEEITITCSN